MNLLKISWSNLKAKSLSTLLSLLLLAMSVGIISLLLLLNKQIQEKFTKNIKGIDMVIGAKGSPLQLILSSVYHIDAPTGNISYSEAQKLTRNPMITKSIPLAYGDSYKSFRLVGTDEKYVEHYGLELAQGATWQADFEVCLGATVARQLELKLGDTFFGSHGLLDDETVHEEHAYKVVGIYKVSNSVADQLILSNISSVWNIHAPHDDHAAEEHDHHDHDHDNHDHEHDHAHDHGSSDEDKEITAMLVKFRSPMGLIQIPRMINTQTKMQAAVPAIQVNRLIDQLGIGIVTIQAIALLIMLVSGISVFISLYNSLKEQKYELALMRSLGASRWTLFGIIILEAFILSILGFIFGLLLSRFGIYFLGKFMDGAYHYNLSALSFVKQEGYLLALTLLIGFLAALLPAIQAFATNISQTLKEG